MDKIDQLETFNKACEQLLKDMYGRDGHCGYLSGKIEGIKQFVNHFYFKAWPDGKPTKVSSFYIDYGTRQLNDIALEFRLHMSGKRLKV